MDGFFGLLMLMMVGGLFLIVLSGVLLFNGRGRAFPRTVDGRPRLVRIPERSVIGGVCAGYAYRLGITEWMVRVAMVFVALFSGMGVLAYLVCWAFMAKASYVPDDYDTRTERF